MIALHTAALTAFISLEQWRCGFRCRFGWPLVQLKSGMILPRGLSAEFRLRPSLQLATNRLPFVWPYRQIRDFISPVCRLTRSWESRSINTSVFRECSWVSSAGRHWKRRKGGFTVVGGAEEARRPAARAFYLP